MAITKTKQMDPFLMHGEPRFNSHFNIKTVADLTSILNMIYVTRIPDTDNFIPDTFEHLKYVKKPTPNLKFRVDGFLKESQYNFEFEFEILVSDYNKISIFPRDFNVEFRGEYTYLTRKISYNYATMPSIYNNEVKEAVDGVNINKEEWMGFYVKFIDFILMVFDHWKCPLPFKYEIMNFISQNKSEA